jgi:hypothetical protein
MRTVTRCLREGSLLFVLGIPVALMALILRPATEDRPRPGESRVEFHVRACPTCRPDEPVTRPLRCPKGDALMKQIQEEFLRSQRGTDQPDPSG